MRKDKAERLLSRELDRELDARRQTELEAEVGASGELKETRAQWASYASLLGALEDPAPPSPATMRADVLRRLRLEEGAESAVPSAVPVLQPVRVWAGVLCLLLVIGTGAWWWLGKGRGPVYSSVPALAVEWVDTDLPDAMPVVYQDQDTGITVIWVESAVGDINHAGS